MLHAGYGNITIKTERGEIMNDKKKILAAAGILVLAGAAATAFYIWKKNKTQVVTSVGIIGGADGPTSIFLAGKLDNSADEGTKAAILDLETAKKQPYGQVVELDYVSIDRISLHGSFGYIAFDINGSDDSATMEPVAAYTLEEAGPIVTQGDEYTEVLGSADGCVVAPKAYMKEKNPMYLYSNTYGDVTELPEKVCKILRENKENGSFKDAYLTDDRLNQMASDIYNEYGSTLLYGPVAIPEFDSEVYGFLAADGDNLEDIWYGIWHAPLEDQTFPITKITLFD